jgi:hypothetical protein
MKIFLSWSCKVSREVAHALYDWLPLVIQPIQPFLSTEDIDTGERWADVLASGLKGASYGIICVTPSNLNSPWMNFEAGAISNAVEQAHVAPFLFLVTPAKVCGPLKQFQFTSNNKQDVFRLLSSINNRLEPASRLKLSTLQKEFEVWWPRLSETLTGIVDSQPRENDTGLEWLYNQDYFDWMLSSNEGGHIGHIKVITPHLSEYVQDLQLEAIRKNAGRGVGYTFLIPKPHADDGVQQSIRILTGYEGPAQIVVKGIPKEDFQRLAVTDYIIVVPTAENSPQKVFLELPLEIRGYWIEVKHSAALGFVKRFGDMEAQAEVLDNTSSG